MLAVLITATVLSAATALASIVVAQLRQSRDTVSSIAALSLAQSRIERALFTLRKTNLTLAEIQDIIAQEASVSESAGEQYFTIPENDFIALAVGADDGNLEANPVITRWSPNIACTDSSWIEISAVSWNTTESPASLRANRQLYSWGSNRDSAVISFPPGTPVEMRVRALYCDIEEFAVSGIPGRVRILAQGEIGEVAQSVETILARRAPAAGLFDFVVFSECEIVKAVGRSPTCPAR